MINPSVNGFAVFVRSTGVTGRNFLRRWFPPKKDASMHRMQLAKVSVGWHDSPNVVIVCFSHSFTQFLVTKKAWSKFSFSCPKTWSKTVWNCSCCRGSPSFSQENTVNSLIAQFEAQSGISMFPVFSPAPMAAESNRGSLNGTHFLGGWNLMQIYGQCIVWVGNILTPGQRVGGFFFLEVPKKPTKPCCGFVKLWVLCRFNVVDGFLIRWNDFYKNDRWSTLPKTNIAPWKRMVGRRSFPFEKATFQGWTVKLQAGSRDRWLS